MTTFNASTLVCEEISGIVSDTSLIRLVYSFKESITFIFSFEFKSTISTNSVGICLSLAIIVALLFSHSVIPVANLKTASTFPSSSKPGIYIASSQLKKEK